MGMWGGECGVGMWGVWSGYVGSVEWVCGAMVGDVG